jgi:hypothetical protein
MGDFIAHFLLNRLELDQPGKVPPSDGKGTRHQDRRCGELGGSLIDVSSSSSNVIGITIGLLPALPWIPVALHLFLRRGPLPSAVEIGTRIYKGFAVGHLSGAPGHRPL